MNHNPLERAIKECLEKGSATLTAEEVKDISDQLRALGSSCPHDWQPDGGVVTWESHEHGETPHVHATCARCGARSWFVEFQWALITAGCNPSPPSQ